MPRYVHLRNLLQATILLRFEAAVEATLSVSQRITELARVFFVHFKFISPALDVHLLVSWSRIERSDTKPLWFRLRVASELASTEAEAEKNSGESGFNGFTC